ncbi:hypothetical protein E3N88_13363 [Mikania micrantha]|uniref:Uncharacterized protein n=1 Tax=Mikania micrantha TaxID=192012 RepID=A0A5N6PA46_9ASTR|nr:hypothetical protein E3N88_13363 [Mikania micrantha]
MAWEEIDKIEGMNVLVGEIEETVVVVNTEKTVEFVRTEGRKVVGVGFAGHRRRHLTNEYVAKISHNDPTSSVKVKKVDFLFDYGPFDDEWVLNYKFDAYIKSAQQLRRSAAAARSSSAGLPDARLLDLPSVELESPIHYYKNTCDIENPTEEAEKFPEIKQIQKKKVMHTQAFQLLRFICGEIAKLDSKRIRDLIGQPLQAAAAMGNVEVVEEILISIPNAIYLANANKHGVFQIAISNLKANVFNLIYQITTQRHLLLAQHDASYNNALHLAANMVGGTKDETTYDLRSSAPGAALQMQRELQWFKVCVRVNNV